MAEEQVRTAEEKCKELGREIVEVGNVAGLCLLLSDFTSEGGLERIRAVEDWRSDGLRVLFSLIGRELERLESRMGELHFDLKRNLEASAKKEVHHA